MALARVRDGRGPAVLCFVGVGSNIDPERNIKAALDMLIGNERVLGCSTFYRSAHVGDTAEPDPPDFVNGVLSLGSSRSPEELKLELRGIEEMLGRARVPGDKNAPRTVDLDLLLHGDRVMDPSIAVYPFVYVPLLELAPDLVLPGAKKPLAALVPQGTQALERLESLTKALKEKVRR